MYRRTARGNRLGLALVGVLLVIGGGVALARGVGVLPGLPADQPLLNAAERSFARDQPWFWYVVAIVAVLIALLALRWLLVQGRRGTVRGLRIDGEATGRTQMPARAASRAVEQDIGGLPGVRRVTARLAGSPSAPGVRLAVTADPRGDPAQLRAGVLHALGDLADSLDVDRLPATVRLGFSASDATARDLD